MKRYNSKIKTIYSNNKLRMLLLICIILCVIIIIHIFTREIKSNVDLSKTGVLSYFDTESLLKVLFRHLCASSKWRVTQEGGIVVAERVALDDQSNRTGGGFQVFDGGHLRITLRFGPYRRNVPWMKQGSYSSADAGASSVSLSLKKAKSGSGHYGSFLVIKGQSLYLQIRESNWRYERVLTKTALEETMKELEAVRDSINIIEEKGYLAEVIPSKSILHSDKPIPLKFVKGKQEGIYHVSGYINPGEPGYTMIRTFDSVTGEEIAKIRSEIYTIEYVGWSSDSSEKFYFESEITIGGDGTDRNVRFEVWFYHNKEKRMLLETTKTVSTWVR